MERKRLVDRKRLAVLAVVGLVLAAGCMDVTMTTEVGADGDIESVTVDIEVDAMVFAMLEETAEMEGYDSVEEYFQADVDDLGDEEFDEVTVTETDDGDYLISMVATNVDPADVDDVDISVDGDTVIYEATNSPEEGLDDGFDDDGFEDDGLDDDPFDDDFDDDGFEDELFDDMFTDDMFSIEYVVIMPGEITDHNADELSEDGTTATWILDVDSDEEQTFYAESSVDGSDGLPGFGLGVAALALVLSALGIGLRSR